MVRFFAILLLPFLGPIATACFAVNLWHVANGTPGGVATYSGGEVPSYYIFVPIALILQIVIGIPIGLTLANTNSRQARAFCVLAPSAAPLVTLIVNGDGSSSFYIEGFMAILPVIGIFACGSLAALYLINPANGPTSVGSNSIHDSAGSHS